MKVGIGSIRDIRGGMIPFEGTQKIITGSDEVLLKNPILVKGSVTNTGEGFLVQALINFTYQADCARCLEPLSRQELIEFKEQFTSDNSTEDSDLFHVSGDAIELEPCIREQVLLAIPMRLICQEDCRGLCQECGANLNQGDCQCVSSSPNPQLANLKSLLPREGGGSDGQPKK